MSWPFWIMAAIGGALALLNWQQGGRRLEAEEIATGLARRLRQSRARERAALRAVQMVTSIKEIYEDDRLRNSLDKLSEVMRETALDELRNIMKDEDPSISIKIDDLLRRTDR